MWEAIETIDTTATPGDVWAVVSDIEGHAQLAGSGEVQSVRVDGPLAPGVTFESDVAVGVVGSFVSRNRIDVVDEPTHLVWKSYPPLDEGETDEFQLEIEWWFLTTPTATGSRIEHGFRVRPPARGAEELADFLERTDRIASVRVGMRGTLDNVRTAAEAPS